MGFLAAHINTLRHKNILSHNVKVKESAIHLVWAFIWLLILNTLNSSNNV